MRQSTSQGLIKLFYVTGFCAFPLYLQFSQSSTALNILNAPSADVHGLNVDLARMTVKLFKFLFLGFAANIITMGRLHAHPAFHSAYRTWLRPTPWRAGRPLPLGSPFFTLWDLPSVAILCATTWCIFRDPAWIAGLVSVGLIGYSLLALPVALLSHRNREIIAILLLFPLAILALPSAWLFSAVILLAYATALHAIRSDLQNPQWMSSPATPLIERNQIGRMDWVTQHLGPMSLRSPRKKSSILWSGLIAAAWTYAIGHQLGHLQPDPENRGAGIAGAFVLIFWVAMAFAHLIKYLSGRRPPLSLAGRIALRQWIIPGFDIIFLAPLTSLLSATLLPYLLLLLHIPTALAFAISVASTIWTISLIGPSFQSWSLTGHWRLIPTPPYVPQSRPQSQRRQLSQKP